MKVLIKIILAVLLLGCLLKMPYGYFQFIRIGATATFVFLAYSNVNQKNNSLLIIYIALAILFQPFFKIIIHRNAWQYIDVIVALFLIIISITETFKRKN